MQNKCSKIVWDRSLVLSADKCGKLAVVKYKGRWRCSECFKTEKKLDKKRTVS